MAAASARAVAPSSSFSAILRRSKFASYDPAIAQVYTTFDGDAHRGNWGLKRPLPLKRRGAHITVAAVDTDAQQTEWTRAEQGPRFLSMFQELGRTPEPDYGGFDSHMWNRQLGHASADTAMVYDSDYAPAVPRNEVEEARRKTEQEQKDRQALLQGNKPVRRDAVPWTFNVPNVDAMSPKEFKRYEAKLRALRPQFLEWLAKRAADGKAEQTVQEELRKGRDLHKEFLQEYYAARRIAKGAQELEPQPHLVAGLSYNRAPPVQAFYMSRPLPGRILGKPAARIERSVFGRTPETTYAATLAGMTALIEKRWTKNPQSHDSSHAKTQETQFRVEETKLRVAPVVVGRSRQGVDHVRITTRVQDFVRPQSFLRNPHAPGSMDWVGHKPAGWDDRTAVGGRDAKYGSFRAQQMRRSSRPGSSSYRVLDTLAQNRRNQQSEVTPDNSPFLSKLSELIRKDGKGGA